ncbi:MAG TPA: M20 family metallopeptidase [Acidobacteriota bacterium]
MTGELEQLRREIGALREPLAGCLLDWVAAESPSQDKAAVDAFGARVAAALQGAGLAVEIEPRETAGDLIHARLAGRAAPILVLGHFDTVHPPGSIRLNPPRREAGRIWGPGAHDMKGGLVALLGALRALQALGQRPHSALEVLLTGDEETGSDQSRGRIVELAQSCGAVLVLEPPLAGGALKTRRKGVGRFGLVVSGRPAHSGVQPEAGVSAIHEMAHQILALEALADPAAGISVTVGIVRGGTRTNVVPERCEAWIDARCWSAGDAERLTAALRALRPRHPEARLELSGGFDRPPLEPTPANQALFERARALARAAGLELRGGETGGGSDGSLTSAAGIATLDGLGPDGAGLHSSDEFILEDSLLERALLLALLLSQL